MESKALRQISYLPEEIIEDILSRLPVKSLLSFKSISQSWHSLISSKHFIKTHLETSTKNPTFAHHKILSYTWKSFIYELKYCSLPSLFSEHITYAIRCDFPIDSSVNSLRLVGCCNGLVCILINKKEFFLWNPATKESKKLPHVEVTIGRWGFVAEHGFGFDKSSGDYKVCAVLHDDYVQIMAKIYSLKTNSWRRIRDIDDGLADIMKGKFVSGKLHWRRKKKPPYMNRRCYISSLDLKNELFGMVEQPRLSEIDFDPVLGDFDGCLSLLYGDPQCSSDLWVMKQYGVKDSWIKLLTIPDYLCYCPGTNFLTEFYVVSCNGEVLFKYDSNLLIYNLKENRFSNRLIIGIDRFGGIDVYVDSLVSIVADIEK
ncbi:hypothetical protein CDL12_10608 [Handroanthus impetiginosus]|uniref:F-box domain-containing protein n=1 Tax=Handroanthus impetiginosus TaxID=429701 RepID=A0A2G9HH32_9LAMI|nr:hypothetical protein CDL12_10608 [Handroanthus impetiginosus]